MVASKTDDTIGATRTSLAIIEEIRRQGGGTVTEIASALDVPKSTVYIHLNTLRKTGYVCKEGKEYDIGLKVVHFGEYARNRDPRFKLAKEYVNRLSTETNEEADFTVEEHRRLVSIYHALGETSESGMQIGSYFYLHNTASGKAIMAEWPREKVQEVIDQWGLPQDTDHTITSEGELIEELERTRERGYGVSDEELIEGFQSAAAVVHTSDGGILGGLSFGGPTYRFDATDPRDANVQRLLEATQDFEDELRSNVEDHEDWWDQYFKRSNIESDL